MNTQLILIDGLPGSGKSTSAQFIALQCKQNELAARWFFELEHAHPIHAFHAWSRKGPEEFITKTLRNWQRFADEKQGSSFINIFESTIFQSTLRLLLQSDLPREQIFDYALQVEQIISVLQPILIYFAQSDVVAAIRSICQTRKSTWEQYITEVIAKSLYGKHHKLKGFEGLVHFFQEYQKLTLELCEHYQGRKLILQDAQRDWKTSRAAICDFLGLTYHPLPSAPTQYLNTFIGSYKDPSSHLEVVVKLEQGRLVLHDLLWSKFPLIPKKKNWFYLQACTIEVQFHENESGEIDKLTIQGNPGWKFYGRRLKKLASTGSD